MLHLLARRVAVFGLVCICGRPLLPGQCPPGNGRINVAQGSYSSQPGVTFLLHHFIATLVPQSGHAPLCYQKTTIVSHAVIFVSNESLTRVFSQKLAGTGSKIRDLQIINSSEGVTLKGTVDKLIPIHFSIFGPVTTDGTALLVHADKVNADGIPSKPCSLCLENTLVPFWA